MIIEFLTECMNLSLVKLSLFLLRGIISMITRIFEIFELKPI